MAAFLAGGLPSLAEKGRGEVVQIVPMQEVTPMVVRMAVRMAMMV